MSEHDAPHGGAQPPQYSPPHSQPPNFQPPTPQSGQYAALPQYASAPNPPTSGASPRRFGAGLLVLTLLVGGLAGALGGYIAGGGSDSRYSSEPNSLDSPSPPKNSAPIKGGSIEAVAQKLLPTVVELEYSSGSGAVTGSGVVFGQDGLILTNNHVVAEDKGAPIRARWRNGRAAEVRIVGQDPTSDLAVVKAQNVSKLPVASFGRSDDLRVGQTVVAFGAPFQLAGTVTSGIVSSLHRPTRAGGERGDQATVLDAVQTDAAINPGNSGGPLVNLSGDVIGINSAIYSPPSSGLGGGAQQAGNVGIGFAIPIDQAKRVGDSLAKDGKATQAVLGVQVQDTPGDVGARVVSVTGGGAADKAGVKTGAIVTTINGQPVDSADALVASVHAVAPGTEVTLGTKDGKSNKVTLGGQVVSTR